MARYRIRRERPISSREAAVEYKARGDQPPQAPRVYHVTITGRGRLVLPADIRGRLNIRDGDRVALTLENDGCVTITTRDVAIRQLRGMCKRPGTRGRLASDELLAERRREARKEDRESREWDARLRKAGK